MNDVKSTAIEVVKSDFSPAVIAAAGIDMSITKADLIDMVIMEQEEKLEHALEVANLAATNFRGYQDYTAFNKAHQNTYNSEYFMDPPVKEMFLAWFRKGNKEAVKVMARYGKEIFVALNEERVRFSTAEMNERGSAAGKFEPCFDVCLKYDKFTEYFDWKEALGALQAEANEYQTQLHKLRSSDRKIKTVMLNRMLMGSPQGEKILAIIAGISAQARFKNPDNLPTGTQSSKKKSSKKKKTTKKAKKK